MVTIPEPIADLIDTHRVVSFWSGNREKAVECACGYKKPVPMEGFKRPLTEENSPRRYAERLHAQHVADVIRAQQEPKGAVNPDHPARELNAVANTIDRLGLSGWVPLSIRYSAAGQILDALKEVEER